MWFVGKGFVMQGRLSFELVFERQMAKKGRWIRKLEEGWRDETVALTVGQGVTLEPIQVLMRHLGQDTAIDDVSAIHHQEAACHAHEQHLHGPPEKQGARQSLRARDLERETTFLCSLDAQCLVSSSACLPTPTSLYSPNLSWNSAYNQAGISNPPASDSRALVSQARATTLSSFFIHIIFLVTEN